MIRARGYLDEGVDRLVCFRRDRCPSSASAGGLPPSAYPIRLGRCQFTRRYRHDTRIEKAVPHLVGGPGTSLFLRYGMPSALLGQVRQIALLKIAEHLRVRDTTQPIGHGFEAGHLLPSLEGYVGV